MTKQINQNIGHIDCPICHQVAAVRKNRGGRFYFDCMHCGRMTPNHSGGQRFILENAVIWGPEGAPATVPAWIREQWPYTKAVKWRDHEGQPAEVCQVNQPPAANDAPGETAQAQAAESPGADAWEMPPPPPPPRQIAEPANDETPPAKADSFLIL